MSESQSRLGQAQAAIRNSRLQHPDDQLLECFLTDSVDPEATVQYMFQRCTDGQKYYDLVPLLSEWKELVRSANQELKPLQELFCLFTGSTIQEQIQCNEDGVYGVQNHWLYRVSQVTMGGLNRPSIVDKVPTVRRGRFIDHSNSGIETPEISLLLATSRFSNSEYFALAFASTCRLMPSRLRIGIYNSLKSLGVRTYGPSSSLKDQQLPFGMYLKTTHSDDYQALANEFGALKLVRDQTRVPVPGPLDADASYLLTTTIPGQRMGSYIDILSDDDLDIFKRDMQKYMAQLRSISRQELQKHAISNAVGGPCYDYRIVAYSDYDKERGDFLGPFIDKAEFNDTLRTPALPDVFHSTGHDIVFTHSDINMRNILMHNGRISGIVDWENSGWFPDYWEYTKAHYVTKLNKR
ncbi:unnamed protein product [Fusarium fujikuroi]|uniref:Aminoglycoside phosphotransferase domain-containing protein n=1 Tax=Fusarium fujikuroi TaxID=5127 RepID=A0A9Q9UFW0_FUSFU|nr:unnamed protein product [Fusarium fujikuroi]VZI06814.1 unnamed protein product [Fusarium fujikuroi]